ncbi:hypothetical protein [Halorarius halobius]|uniref:hypothetical protein n=1 Tax=Halorarius halobius TaxID=2962671 RepID=UPI0020CF519E|nr:hypothetical protein [Halorarius halobius]
MRGSLRRAGIGLYLCWLGAVVLLMLGRYTSVPLYEPVHGAVVAGAAVLTVVGAAGLLRRGYRRVAG